ncbi:MAG: hypothetical protein AB9897_02255 [Anaerolineaceae bacterium]
MKRPSMIMLIFAAGLILLGLACNLTAPTGNTAGNVETAVAGTLAALTPTVMPSTAEPHSVLTEVPPVVSPIVVPFVTTGRNLYVWTDGTPAPIQLTNGGDVERSYISYDGLYIAYLRIVDSSTYELDVINADGTNQRVLMSAAAFAALPRPADSLGLTPQKISWVSESHRLVLSLRVYFEGPGLQIADTLYTIDADSGAVTPLINPGQNYNFSLSPNGAWLVITRPTGIDLYTSAGALVSANVVSHEFVNTASEYAWTAEPAWQVDSSNFIMAIPPKEPWDNIPAPSAVWRVSNAGSASNVFTDSMSFFPNGIASFNPTLTRMAFTTQVGVPTDNIWALHLANLDGSADTTIDNGYFSQLPVWSPDGNNFVYSKLVGSIRQAYLVQGGAAPVLIADITSLTDMRWLDNSRFIAASSNGSGASLLLETLGSASGVIFNDPGAGSVQDLNFDVNR